MGRLHRLPLRLRRLLNRLLVLAGALPPASRAVCPGELLFAARVKIGMSQAEAAERAGLSQQYWHGLESGKRDARLETWRRAFAGLACDVILVPRPRRNLGEWRARRILAGIYSARSVPRTGDD